ncbi:MAG: ankyrin repeat domain-containing protein [Puniceicoccales bacterium]|jgi:hypothetical protein|nr:ankyrin repeat domain-containing protein [Puniceicoccales bacterium]
MNENYNIKKLLKVVLLGSFVGVFSQLQAGRLPELHKAVGDGDIAKVRELLAQGADPNEREKLLGDTSIVFAENAEMIDLLRSHGGNINAQNNYGETVLHAAVSSPSPDLAYIRLLLEKGADKYIRDRGGDTPLAKVEGTLKNEIVCSAGFASNSVGSEDLEVFKQIRELLIDQPDQPLKNPVIRTKSRLRH